MLNIKKGSVTILAIDDDPTVLKLIENTFGKNGYNVLTAMDGTNGLEIAAKHNPDLIILDIILPDFDGFTVLKRLRESPSTARISVVMLTVKKLDADIQKGLDLGAEDYIPKPLHPGLLIKRVENVLKKIVEED